MNKMVKIMCGRFSLNKSQSEINQYLQENFCIEEIPSFTIPRYNIAPTQQIIVVIHDGIKNRVGLIKWGFAPMFSNNKSKINSIFNARSETLTNKPLFKHLLMQKRCLVIADSFYEWENMGNNKNPYRILFSDNRIFAMAGLWDSSINKDGSKSYSCTIITTQANEIVSPIHERMPVILTSGTLKPWLNPAIKDLKVLTSVLTPYDSREMDK
jgi:putative SOS response-associated peptidase YedK